MLVLKCTYFRIFLSLSRHILLLQLFRQFIFLLLFLIVQLVELYLN